MGRNIPPKCCSKWALTWDMTVFSSHLPRQGTFKFLAQPLLYYVNPCIICSLDDPPAEPQLVGAHLGELCRPQQTETHSSSSSSWRGIRRTSLMAMAAETLSTSLDRDGVQTRCCVCDPYVSCVNSYEDSELRFILPLSEMGNCVLGSSSPACGPTECCKFQAYEGRSGEE